MCQQYICMHEQQHLSVLASYECCSNNTSSPALLTHLNSANLCSFDSALMFHVKLERVGEGDGGGGRGEGRGRGSLEKESPSRTRCCKQYDAKNSSISILSWLGADTQSPVVKANTLERLDGHSARVDPDCLLL